MDSHLTMLHRPRVSRLIAGLFAAVLLIPGGPIRACPLCDTSTGQAVRDGLFDGNLTANLLAVFAPFVLVLAVVAVIHLGGRRPRIRNREHEPERI
jgi:hypothetical protein